MCRPERSSVYTLVPAQPVRASDWPLPARRLLLTLSGGTEMYRYHCGSMTSADVYAHTMPSETGRTSPEAQRLRQASPEHATPRRRRAVTIAQVVAETGLSTATVSKVLNGKPDVSPRLASWWRTCL